MLQHGEQTGGLYPNLSASAGVQESFGLPAIFVGSVMINTFSFPYEASCSVGWGGGTPPLLVLKARERCKLNICKLLGTQLRYPHVHLRKQRNNNQPWIHHSPGL